MRQARSTVGTKDTEQNLVALCLFSVMDDPWMLRTRGVRASSSFHSAGLKFAGRTMLYLTALYSSLLNYLLLFYTILYYTMLYSTLLLSSTPEVQDRQVPSPCGHGPSV